MGARLDLLLWLNFLSNFNGVSILHEHGWEDDSAIQLFTDAAASIGFGAYFNGKWVQGRWPEDVLRNPPSIAFLEMFPLVVAVLCWAPLLTNCKITFHTDNLAVMHIINQQSSHCPKIMHLVRMFVLEYLRYNIVFRAVHVPGKDNIIADALSRFQISRFQAAAPHAEANMTPLPSFPQIW